jgi:hypothetical protein
LLDGTPAIPGSYPFFIRVIDSAGRYVDASYVMNVSP